MKIEFVPFGEELPGNDPGRLVYEISKRVYSACLNNKDFELIELRKITRKNGEINDIIVVDCINDQVPSRNSVGIKVRERLALVFSADKLPEVRVLRKNFPIVPHLNVVSPNEPLSLCLYFEPWSAAVRTWTAQKHLHRILWWLSGTAKGTLHADDQSLEPAI